MTLPVPWTTHLVKLDLSSDPDKSLVQLLTELKESKVIIFVMTGSTKYFYTHVKKGGSLGQDYGRKEDMHESKLYESKVWM